MESAPPGSAATRRLEMRALWRHAAAGSRSRSAGENAPRTQLRIIEPAVPLRVLSQQKNEIGSGPQTPFAKAPRVARPIEQQKETTCLIQ